MDSKTLTTVKAETITTTATARTDPTTGGGSFGSGHWVIHDSSGNGRDGYLLQESFAQQAGPGIVPGNTALKSLAASYPSFPPSVSGNDFKGPFALDFWIGPNTKKWLSLQVERPLGVNTYDYMVQITYIPVIYTGTSQAGAFRFEIGNQSAQSPNLVAAGTYHENTNNYIAYTYDVSRTVHLYVNGVELFSSTLSTPTYPSSTPTLVLWSPLIDFTSYMTLDELAFYTSLSAARVSAHYAAGLSSFAAYNAAVMADGPRGYYHLDDINGTLVTPSSERGQAEAVVGPIQIAEPNRGLR